MDSLKLFPETSHDEYAINQDAGGPGLGRVELPSAQFDSPAVLAWEPTADNIRAYFYDFFLQDEGDVRVPDFSPADSDVSVAKPEHADLPGPDFEIDAQDSSSNEIVGSGLVNERHSSLAYDCQVDAPNTPVLLAPSHAQVALSEDPSSGSPCDAGRLTIDLHQYTLPAEQQKNPRKRRREYFEGVEITVPAWSKREYRRVKQETRERQEREFLHPRFKIKRAKEDVSAGLHSVFRRVDALKIKPLPLDLDLDDDLLNFTVSRKFLSSVYGGNSQSTFPSISPDNRARHDYHNFMFLHIEYNPFAPQRAGFPGLFYRIRTTDLPEIHRVFIRIDDGIWLYIGQYQLVQSDPLTPQEWAASSIKARRHPPHLFQYQRYLTRDKQTKNRWCNHISQQVWGAEIRVRIALRKALGREPTPEECENAIGGGAGVTSLDVRAALDSGEEAINVWIMKCVAYDHTFQREMREKFLKLKQKEENKSNTATDRATAKSKTKKNNSTKGKNGKGKRQDIATSDTSNAQDPEAAPKREEQSPSPDSGVAIADEDTAASRYRRAIRLPTRFLPN
ncbi:hypothetical protein D9615_009588 [Tricholomella constricta]|uniref:DUF6697 domain-containing protein n=1 Tax=Tricholomella constricta TaxID=117010 RepID=A0A8H5GUX3_9AGAR|nr:hypothetical protein D9615_009588 [Tricholomella constricta]